MSDSRERVCQVFDMNGVPTTPAEIAWQDYRKKPVVIQACQLLSPVNIVTLEGTMHAQAGDWLIRGVKGELYPCKPDIFEATYEVAE